MGLELRTKPWAEFELTLLFTTALLEPEEIVMPALFRRAIFPAKVALEFELMRKPLRELEVAALSVKVLLEPVLMKKPICEFELAVLLIIVFPLEAVKRKPWRVFELAVLLIRIFPELDSK